MQVSSQLHGLLRFQTSEGEHLWRVLLRRDFGMTEKTIKRLAAEHLEFRQMYALYARSRISPCGSLSQTVMDKHVRRNKRLKVWAYKRGLGPFYVAQLYHTSTQGPRTIVAKHSIDDSSHFGTVLEMRRCWNIQVEGATRAFGSGYFKVVWRLRLAPDYEDLGPLHFLCKVELADEALHLLTEEERRKKDRSELSWSEDELVHPLRLDGSRLHFIWNPPNPMPVAPPDQQPHAGVHPNDRPFGAPEPQVQREDGGFGIDAMRGILELHNRIRGHADAAVAAIADRNNLGNFGNGQMPNPAEPRVPNFGEDDGPPGLIPVDQNQDDRPTTDSSAAFPVNEWFDLLTGFIHVPQPQDAVCFALTNFTIGFKYGLFIDYVALVPVSKFEFDNRDSFPLGPLLVDGPDYWDLLCDNAAYAASLR